jgi:sugar phosphate isomerase/epimerase
MDGFWCNKKLDDFKKAADDLNNLGELCNKKGIRFAMHNHDKEFVPVQGYEWGYEVLLKETDPANVGNAARFILGNQRRR